MTFFDALALDAVQAGTTHGVEVDGVYLVVIRVNDSVFALDGYCSHERQELGEAPLDGFTMYCPRHFSSFDVRSGEVLGPPAEQGLRRYDTKVSDGRVYIDIPDDMGPGGEVGNLSDTDDADSADKTKQITDISAADGLPIQREQVPRLSRLADSGLVRRWSGVLFALVEPFYRVLHRRGLADWLHGTRPVGHPLHPALTDLPFGLWLAGVILYTAGYPGAGAIATVAGVVAALAAVATGLADWVVSEGRDRRLGALHGGANLIAIAAEVASVVLFYSAGAVGPALALCAAGLVLSLVSAYVGGHLVFDRGAMVNHVAFVDGPRVWTRIGRPDEVSDGEVRPYAVDGRRIIVWRDGSQWSAIEGACSHAGARLDQGEIIQGSVTCPLHGSVFSLRSGAVLRGPAIRPQPCLDIRVDGESLEVRTRADPGKSRGGV